MFESDSPIIAWQLRTEQALIVDAIDMYAKALFEIMHNEDIVTSAINNKNLDCEASGSWEQGLSIINLMKTVINRNQDFSFYKNCCWQFFRVPIMVLLAI